MSKKLKLLHVTDPHFDYAPKFEYDSFISKVRARDFDIMVISGDICDGAYADKHLSKLLRDIKKPIFFVLGNHDYYNTSCEFSQAKATQIAKGIHYLSTMPSPIKLNPNVAIVGDDGFYDGLHGEGARTKVQLIDFRKTFDFAGRNKFDVMAELAQASAARLRGKLEEAVDLDVKTILVATHVPPFVESSRHRGKISSDEFLPLFSSKTMGDLMLEVANKHKDIDFFVLCGHTHCPCVVTVEDNLIVCVGEAHIGGQIYFREMMI